jgi:hypothetical protein
MPAWPLPSSRCWRPAWRAVAKPASKPPNVHIVHIVDCEQRAITWTYGVLGVKGHAPGYLNYPDGVDLDLYRDWKIALPKK